jgi:diguanylate cyclase (GGDEF)-like protein
MPNALARLGPPRLLAFVLPLIAAATPLFAGAASAAVLSRPDGETLVGVIVFFALALMAELRPLALDTDGREISLAFVFVVAAGLLFGWQWSVLIGATAIVVAMLPPRSGAIKVFFNGATYAVAAGLALLPSILIGIPTDRFGYPALIAVVAGSGAIFVVTNVGLVCVVIALASGERVRDIVREHLRHSGQGFSIMVFIVVQAVIFWDLSPFLLALVGAPLFTLTLYQASSVRGQEAEAAAATDGLTGVGNRRAYEADMAELLEDKDAFVTLCLIDVDRFKQVNDRHGHPVGDAVLSLLGELIAEIAPGRGYRLGGDEFALLLPIPLDEGEVTCQHFHELFAERQGPILPEQVTLSSGVAAYPQHAEDAHTLAKHADLALYQSKRNGKNRSSTYATDEVYEPVTNNLPSIDSSRIDPRLATPLRLVTIVDEFAVAAAARSFGRIDTGTSELRHSRNVAQLARGLAMRLGYEGEELELLTHAALLHDLGKIAIPDGILNKPGPLTPEEFELVRQHPQIGYDLLGGLGLAPIDTWIRHHHEHWDGSGYPNGLAGGEIPFGSRLILVADAFDAMTCDRSYRRAISIESAMQELHNESGRQFDPIVVAALEDYLAHPNGPRQSSTEELAWSS